ncbi:MAG: cytochrome c biogenesis protein ResB [Chloroflexi bacterium]|nr:cytochrome c biogenesis protein ResB [Chloroflexota bacterium]
MEGKTLTTEGAKTAAARRSAGLARQWARPIRRLFRSAWRVCGSVRVTVVLILVLIGLSLVGTLLIQVPGEVAADRAEYAWWLQNVVRPKLGLFTTPLAFLGFFDVFHSLWFLGAGALLMASIMVCSINRWKALRSALDGSRVKLADGFYEGGSSRAQFSDLAMSAHEAEGVTRGVLARRRYRVRREGGADGFWIAADKNRHFRLGTYLHHGSIVLFVLGFLVGSYFGFRSQSFMVPEGSVREVGYGSGLSLELESFVDEYWPEGPPKDFRSQVILYENGAEVKRGVLRVNHPMSYNGVRFYQSFFGQAAVLEVRDSSGKLLFNDGVALGWLSGQEPYKRPTGMFSVPVTGLTAYVVGPAKGYSDPMVQPGQVLMEVYSGSSKPVAVGALQQGVPKKMAGLEFTFVRERQFSGFQVSRDPGNALIWTASSLFVLGVGMVFYFPHQQIWVRGWTEPGKGTRLRVRTASGRQVATAREFETLVEDLDRELARAVKKV